MADEYIQRRLLLQSTLTLRHIILPWPKRWHRTMPQFSDRPLPPLVLMLSRQTWMLTKFHHHVNIVGIHKNFVQILVNRTLLSGSCYRCASTDHLADKCKHKNTECHKIDQLERAFLSRKRTHHDQKYVKATLKCKYFQLTPLNSQV